MTQRKTPKERVKELLDVAIALAVEHGYLKVTREQIAEAAGVSPALVSHHLGTMADMRRTLVRQAVTRQVLKVVGQALASNDPHARKAPDALKNAALASLAR